MAECALIPVILAGGVGERLWPLSKVDYPKQFLCLDDSGLSLFQATLARVADRARFAAPIILCSADHRFLVSEQLAAIGCADATILVEPVARNTAPAVLLAAFHITSTRAPNAVMVVMPSDHQITQPAALLRAVETAATAAQDGWLVTFAITPDAPETAYGYIKLGAPLAGHAGLHSIGRFIEKPNADAAHAYLAEGGYGWNSGMFVMEAATALAECATHAPAMFDIIKRIHDSQSSGHTFIHFDEALMGECQSISFDYAVMEHTSHGAAMPVDMGWSDLGSWVALDAASPKDVHGNACIGRAITHDVSGCYIRSGDALVAAIGLRDMVVIAADNAVMVGPKERMQEVKTLLAAMRASALPDTHLTSFAHRPWGGYVTIDRSADHQVKKLRIIPGGKISMQSHQHRCEHWVVVKGRATVTRDGDVVVLGKNESAHIPAGTTHRLENREAEDLIVIEVQTGDYLGEDDIQRFEDAYQRI
ncbi:MAG: mannose-1-phosphate guanylyltransferase/mannose-6-phosphate isomerase [Pseudomonadota bacterium]